MRGSGVFDCRVGNAKDCVDLGFKWIIGTIIHINIAPKL